MHNTSTVNIVAVHNSTENKKGSQSRSLFQRWRTKEVDLW